MLLAAMLPVVVVCLLAAFLSAAASRMGRTADRIDRDRKIEAHLEHILVHLAMRDQPEVMADFRELRVLVPRATPNDPLRQLEADFSKPIATSSDAENTATLVRVHGIIHYFRAQSVAYVRSARITDSVVVGVMWLGALLSIAASVLTALWLSGHADRFAVQKQATLKARQQAHEVLSSMTDAMITVNVDWRIIGVGDQAGPLLESAVPNLLGARLWDVLPPFSSVFEQEVRRSSEGQIPLYFEEYLAGSDRWLEFRTLPLDDSLSIYIKDNTELHRQREIKQELLQRIAYAANEWQHLFDGMDAPILVVDAAGTLLRMNEVARQLAKQDYQILIGSNVRHVGESQLWSVAGTLAELVCESRRPAEVRAHDMHTGQTWEVRATHYVQPNGDVRAIVKGRDVTEIIALEESLRLADKLSTIGLVTAGVAHEVRNPLFSISSLVDALDSTFPNRDELRPFMERLRNQVDRMRNLMTDLLEYGRASSPKQGAGTLSHVVESAIAMCRSESGSEVDVTLTTAGDCSDIIMDAPRLELVFRNLIENAQQHAPAGSRIDVVIDRVRTLDREWIQCTVADRGAGFAESDLSRVFEPFYTRRKGGTGLGLSIVQRIVLEHHGNVRAANRVGGGAEVIVRFPAQELSAAATAAEEVYAAR